MPNYTKTGPFTNGGAPGISASFLNNIENVFKQSSGGTETGSYFVEQGAFATGSIIGVYITSLSRGATPVSVSVDTTIQSPTGVGSPVTTQLNANGFYVYATASGVSNTPRVGGNWTIQY